MAPLMQMDLKGMGIGPGQGCHVANTSLHILLELIVAWALVPLMFEHIHTCINEANRICAILVAQERNFCQ